MAAMTMETLAKIEKLKKIIDICDVSVGCTGCPFSDDIDCDATTHQLMLEIIDELTGAADVNLDLHKEYYDTIVNLVADRKKRLEKRCKRACDDMNFSNKYLTVMSKIPQNEWSVLDTWRVGFQEGRAMANKEWLEWLEDNLNE